MNDPVLLRSSPTPNAPALVLRPWREKDVPALVEAYRDAALRRWTTPALDDDEDAARWIRIQEHGWATGDRFGFAVLETTEANESLAGHVVLKGVAPGRTSAEVGYWTVARARGRGVASRALAALTGWAFDARGLRRLELLHQVDNLASCRVADKSGYALKRTLPPSPPAFPLDGHLHVRHAVSPANG